VTSAFSDSWEKTTRRSFLWRSAAAGCAFAVRRRGRAQEAPSAGAAGDLSALLHQVFISDSPELYRFAERTYSECVLGKVKPPAAPLKHAWIVPGGGYYAQWLWDTMFVADLLAILPGQRDLLRGVFQNYWDFQVRWDAVMPATRHGMIANFIAPYGGSKERDGIRWKTAPAYSQAPLLAWGMERVFHRNGDKELLRAGLAPLEAFHEWYWRERDLTGVGLVGVGSYSGVMEEARYETYDQEVDLDTVKLVPHPGQASGADNGLWYGDIAIPSNTAYLLLSEASLARLAEVIGDDAMAARRRARLSHGAAAVRRYMWDEESGCFLAVRFTTLEKIRTATVGGFMPMIAKVPTRSEARKMAAMLASPAWTTPLPVPTVARNDPQFSANSFWRGDVWPVPDFQVASGLAAYGLRDEAARIADALVANALKAGISEHYDSLTGEPLGVAGLGMSATSLTVMLDGLTSSRFNLRVRSSHA
jgi:glycogen debranching enzyme